MQKKAKNVKKCNAAVDKTRSGVYYYSEKGIAAPIKERKTTMKIKADLLKSANMNPTKETRQQTIDDLCHSIDAGILTLPLYQRDLSWTIQKCVDLLNYQLSGKAPVSAISFNIINDESIAVPQVAFISRELIDIKPGLNSVVDGQQRITTNYKAYIGSEDFKNIVLDLVKGKFIEVEDGGALKPSQVPVGVLLNKDGEILAKYIKNHKALDKFDVQNALIQVRNKFKSYYYTINQAKDLSEDEQINWFEVLNNAGSRVTAIQMRLAKLKIVGIDIYTDYAHKYVDKIKEHGYDEVFIAQTTNLSYPICALSPAYEVIVGQLHSNNYCPMASDCKENAICNMEPAQIELAFKITLEALDRALDFIDKNNFDHPDRVDYINYLLGYFVFHSEPLDQAGEEYLIHWYENTDFTNTSNTTRRNIFSKLLNRM